MWVVTLPHQKNSQGYQLSLWQSLMIFCLFVFNPSPKPQMNGGVGEGGYVLLLGEKKIYYLQFQRDSSQYDLYGEKIRSWNSFFKARYSSFLMESLTLGIGSGNEVHRNPLRLGRRFGECREAVRYVFPIKTHQQSQAKLPVDAILVKSNSVDLETSGYFPQWKRILSTSARLFSLLKFLTEFLSTYASVHQQIMIK